MCGAHLLSLLMGTSEMEVHMCDGLDWTRGD